ncbi:glycogen synthase isoform 1 [Coemansia javaensis]|uniref:Glycogen [starch] synthase n=1 Tax=Coemansia javaensis TaxID=2761396 RepID=A0A9W8H428_9FUNG|nr:glycogen synthase isoform 1 [Coemansia javaensis]
MRDVSQPLLFETSWEVANKVGGIYTVIKTKVPVTVQEYGDRYHLTGPWNRFTAHVEVEEIEPELDAVAAALAAIRADGIQVLYGRWLIDGAPRVILFDIGSAAHKLDEWKGDIWRVAGIPSPPNDIETNDAIILGYLNAWLFGEATNCTASMCVAKADTQHAIIAQFHEWQAGIGAVLCNKRKIDVATIFTTHATLLGRYLCAGNVDFYNNLKHFNVDEEAGKRGIYHRYCIERAAAHCVDVFTTVSNITAYEAEYLLKRKPDGVLPNGLNVVKFSAMHEFQNLHQVAKERIHHFVRGHFYGHYNFELEDTLYFFTAGRYEYRNKGIDMYVEALARLNGRLRACNSPITVVAFIITPAKVNSFTVETLKGQALIKQLEDTVAEVSARVGKRIFEMAARGREPHAEDLLTEQDRILLKRRVFSLKRDSLPPIVTHNMVSDHDDPVLSQLRAVHLFNNDDDRVKVVFHPEFLNANNPVIGLDYEEFIRGTHLGVFPSYYEPWGYTPAECTVMGVPSITTNLSGFGCFMEDNIVNPQDYGIYIVDRRLKSADESIEQLAGYMFEFCQKSRRQRINQRNRTERLSDILDWKRMGIEYMKARQCALRRCYPEAFEEEEEEEGAGASSPYGSGPGAKLSRPQSIPGTPLPGADLAMYDLAALSISAELPGVRTQEDEDHDLRPPIQLKMKTPLMTPTIQTP